MPQYHVQLCPNGPTSCGEWQIVDAVSEQAAAEAAAGIKLRAAGTRGELRARVRAASYPPPAVATAFYADL